MLRTKKYKKILGLAFFYHDSAAALIVDGKVLAAAQEERFTRVKHDESFPQNAIEFCLKNAGITIEDIDCIVFYEKPILKFDRLITTYINTWPRGLFSFVKAMQVWFKDKLWTESVIRKKLSYSGEIFFSDHHLSHAASSYFCSEFTDATIVTLDGVGEWNTTTIGWGEENSLHLTDTINFPHSIGLLYSAVTYYLGFKVNSAEYKVMGLAPYGDASVFFEKFKKLITIKDDGGFKLDMSYFAYEHGLTMTSKKFHDLFGGTPRTSETEITTREKDIAAALQKITEEAILKIVAHAKKKFPSENLCLAGGVALNCVANGKIMESGLFKNIYIQPAAGDAGGAIGAALYFYYTMNNGAGRAKVMETAYLGTEYSNAEIKEFLEHGTLEFTGGEKIIYTECESEEELIEKTAEILAQDKDAAIGWFQGKMEFGPRALGNRSIIADPRNKENWRRVNLKIKFRESFRPFAPAVLEEESRKYFTLPVPSPYMLLVSQVTQDIIPAVTHVDNSARVQTVNRHQNKKFYDLIKRFFYKTGCAVIINTSFNVRGEPIVESPRDAFNSFMNTYLDYLVIGNFIIKKKDNLRSVDEKKLKKYLGTFLLD